MQILMEMDDLDRNLDLRRSHLRNISIHDTNTAWRRQQGCCISTNPCNTYWLGGRGNSPNPKGHSLADWSHLG